MGYEAETLHLGYFWHDKFVYVDDVDMFSIFWPPLWSHRDPWCQICPISITREQSGIWSRNFAFKLIFAWEINLWWWFWYIFNILTPHCDVSVPPVGQKCPISITSEQSKIWSWNFAFKLIFAGVVTLFSFPYINMQTPSMTSSRPIRWKTPQTNNWVLREIGICKFSYKLTLRW